MSHRGYSFTVTHAENTMKKREINPFGLRLRPALKEKAKDEADRNRHSMNTELEMLIEDGFKWREKQSGQAVA